MTTTIDGSTATFYINNPELTSDTLWNTAPDNWEVEAQNWETIGTDAEFNLKSQYSQEIVLANAAYSIVVQNDRYAKIVVDVPADFKDTHQNGWYTWSLGDYSDIVKIITQPGGDIGKVEYISNNEDRDAEVYFRPNY